MNCLDMIETPITAPKKEGLTFFIVVFSIVSVTFIGGCATNYSPRADLSSVETMGVAVPAGASEPEGAEDVFQLYAIGEDRLATSAAGAGAGAAAGTAAGVGAGAIIGCAGLGPLALPCWGMLAAAGAVTGGATGAIAGAVVDPDDPVDAAPVHLYAVNQVLPELIREQLASDILEIRALQTVRAEQMPIEFIPASWNGDRYAAVKEMAADQPSTNVYLVLSAMNVSLKGKAKEDPKIALTICMQWSVTKYNPETQKDEIWDAWPATYESKKIKLSKWLDNDAALLKAEVDKGIQQTLDSSFSNPLKITFATDRQRGLTWAQRLKRVFAIDIDTCRQCGGRLRVIACIEQPEVIERILGHLGGADDPVDPAHPSRAPPERARLI